MSASVDTKLLVTDLAATVQQVPSRYVRPISDRPNFSDVRPSHAYSFSVIDLHALDGPSRSDVVDQIGRACERDGFFLVINSFNSITCIFYFLFFVVFSLFKFLSE